MPNSAQAAPIEFEVRPEGFRELMLRMKDFDAAQTRLLRKNIRVAALGLVSNIRAVVLGGTYETDAGLRQGIADGLKVQISTSKNRPGVRIAATKSRMPAGKQGMVRAWQRNTFRHPVFRPEVFVDQEGHPYFDDTITAGKEKVTTAVTSAMKQAAETLAGGSAG